MKELPNGLVRISDILDDAANAEYSGVYSNGVHREMIQNVKRVIVNNPSDMKDSSNIEPEVLIIGESIVTRITVNQNGCFIVKYTKLNEIYNEFGRRVNDEGLRIGEDNENSERTDE